MLSLKRENLIFVPNLWICNSIEVGSSAHRQNVLPARDKLPVSRMSSQGVLRLLPLLSERRTREAEHLRSFAGKERSPSREALEQRKAEPLTLNPTLVNLLVRLPHACERAYCATGSPRSQTHGGRRCC